MQTFNTLTRKQQMAQLKLVVGDAIDTYNAGVESGRQDTPAFKAAVRLLKTYKVIK